MGRDGPGSASGIRPGLELMGEIENLSLPTPNHLECPGAQRGVGLEDQIEPLSGGLGPSVPPDLWAK